MNKIVLYFKTRNKTQIKLALIVMFITLSSMALLYNYGFNIWVKNDEVLSSAIDDYFFTESVDAKILVKQHIGRELFIFFQREGYEGHHGIATLERGIFGKCRFVRANLSDYPLYLIMVNKKRPFFTVMK